VENVSEEDIGGMGILRGLYQVISFLFRSLGIRQWCSLDGSFEMRCLGLQGLRTTVIIIL
jgi:hypothetical protein